MRLIVSFILFSFAANALSDPNYPHNVKCKSSEKKQGVEFKYTLQFRINDLKNLKGGGVEQIESLRYISEVLRSNKVSSKTVLKLENGQMKKLKSRSRQRFDFLIKDLSGEMRSYRAKTPGGKLKEKWRSNRKGVFFELTTKHDISRVVDYAKPITSAYSADHAAQPNGWVGISLKVANCFTAPIL